MTSPEVVLCRGRADMIGGVFSDLLVSRTVVAPVNVMSEVKPSDLSSRREPTRAMAMSGF